MGSPAAKRLYTIREYLELERISSEKHEYRDGQIIAVGDNAAVGMAGGSYRHSLISANFVRELGNALKGKTCRVLESNLRVRIPKTPLFAYPDVSVICGEPKFDAGDDRQETLTNPRLVAEVLSPTTEGYDRGEKFTRYRQIDSFQEYLLVSQEVPRVEAFFRQPDGTWLFSVVSGMDASVRLKSLGVEISLSEIYAGVEFPPPPQVPADPPV